MKTLNFFIVTFLCTLGLSAQEEELNPIANKACECLSTIKTSIEDDEKLVAIEECISTAITSAQVENSVQELFAKTLDTLNQVDLEKVKDTILVKDDNDIIIDTSKNYDEIEAILLEECPRMRLLLNSKDVERENSISDRKKAKKFYDKGQDLYTKGEYRKAIVQYEKAVKKDKNFAFALDMIGISYRKLNEFEEAIKYYKKSLKVDPKGKMPLGNIPYAYEFLGKYDEAISAYGDYAKIYPDDPELYYGLGRLYHKKEDYENALDHMMNAYLKYKETNSPYANDAEHNIVLFYNELKEKDQLAIFRKMAAKYDIKMEE